MKKIRVICPLLNFQVQNMLYSKGELSQEEIKSILIERNTQIINGIELYKDIKIRQFTKDDIKNFRAYPFMSFHSLDKHISTRTFMLEKTIESDENEKSKTAKLMRNIVLALRLLKEGHIYGDDVFNFDAEKGTFSSWSREGLPPISEIMGMGYGLNFEDIPQLKEMINKIQKIDIDNRKSLDLACKRFQRAYQEYEFDDKLIDYMIIFPKIQFRKSIFAMHWNMCTHGLSLSTWNNFIIF